LYKRSNNTAKIKEKQAKQGQDAVAEALLMQHNTVTTRET